MPYRGTNTKRQVVHDKSSGTIREGARTHFLNEKKEHEHELHRAKESVHKWFNDGYHYEATTEVDRLIRVTFVNSHSHRQQLDFAFPDNYDLLKSEIIRS